MKTKTSVFILLASLIAVLLSAFFAVSLSAEEGDVVTEYGTIPAQYASADDYPFAVFDGKGNFLAAYAVFYGANTDASAVGRAKVYLSSNVYSDGGYGASPRTAVVLMRRDYVLEQTEVYNNLAQVQGEITIDLGGHTLSRAAGSTRAIFGLQAKAWPGSGDAAWFPSSIRVVNGGLKIAKQAVMTLQVYEATENAQTADKLFDVRFSDIRFSYTADAAFSTLLTTLWSRDKTSYAGEQEAPFHITYTDCVFDMTERPSAATTLFVSQPIGNFGATISVRVEGGRIEANDFSNVTLTSGDSVLFARGSDGAYTKIRLPSGAAAPAAAVQTDEGERSYAPESEANGYCFYKPGIGADNVETPYGTIPEAYASAEVYPFALFDGNGTFLYACEVLYGVNAPSSAAWRAKDYLAPNVWNGTSYGASPRRAVILMRRDYEIPSDDKYDNLAQVQGELTIDLGGFALSRAPASARPIMPISSKGWTGSGDAAIFPTTIRFTNGKLLAGKAAVFAFSTWDSLGDGSIANKHFHILLDGVTVGLASGADTSALIANFWSPNGTPLASAPFHLSFDRCVFDLATVAPRGKITLFNMAGGAARYVDISVEVKGGRLLSDDIGKVSLTDGAPTFPADADGRRFAVSLPAGAEEPTAMLSGAGAGLEAVFLPAAEENGRRIFELSTVPLVGFKQNVVLTTEFRTNVFIPNKPEKAIRSVSCGETLLPLVERQVDGADYLVATVAVDARRAVEDVLLTIEYTYEGEICTQVLRTSVAAYAEELLRFENGLYADLADAMLCYAVAAATDREAAAQYAPAAVPAQKAEPVCSFVPDSPVLGASFALVDAPIFVFAVDPAFSGLLRFEWRSGEATTVAFKSAGEGAQIALGEMRLYDLAEVVSVSYADGNGGWAEAGRYNLSAYAASEAGRENEALIDALYGYAAAAERYVYAEQIAAEVVIKDGKSATVTYVIDDGNTADALWVATEEAAKYEHLQAGFAVPVKYLGTLSTYTDEDGKLAYVVDEDGRYVYQVNEANVAIWQQIVSSGRFDVYSHSFSHAYFGEDDNGGVYTYTKNDGTTAVSQSFPKGNVTAELAASAQIIRDLLPGQNASVYIKPGVGAVLSNYYYDLLNNGGYYIGARATANNPAYPAAMLNYAAALADHDNRYSILAYMVEHYATSPDLVTNSSSSAEDCLAAGIPYWTGYIDAAIENGGWACFCFHRIIADDATGSGHFVYRSQADALFGYVEDRNDDIWMTTYEDATVYYNEWSTASVSACVLRGGDILVSLRTGEVGECYGAALTVKVALPGNWGAAVYRGADALTVFGEGEERYVLVDLVPGERLTLTEQPA